MTTNNNEIFPFEIKDSEFPESPKKEELSLDKFKTDVIDSNIDDDTIGKVFWEIYRKNRSEAAEALKALDKCEFRKKLAEEIAYDIKND